MSQAVEQRKPKRGKPHVSETTTTSTVTSTASERPEGKLKIDTGELVHRRYRVGKMLGKGGFGAVFEAKDEKTKEIYAIKIELVKPPKNMPGLSLETSVLKRIQKNVHFARYVEHGTHRGVDYLIMQLVGKNLADLRRACPDGKFTFSTAIRVGFQCFEAIEHMHKVGLLHRDIKPGNFTVGAKDKDARIVYLLDFGLVRKFMTKDGKLRPQRPRAAFRGTRRYASPNVLQDKDCGRHDDLIGWLYSIVELCTGQLPWPNENDRFKLAQYKLAAHDRLFIGTHNVWVPIYNSLISMNYFSVPLYSQYKAQMVDAREGVKSTEPLDWQLGGSFYENVQKSLIRGPVKRHKEEQVSGEADEDVE